MRRVRLQDVAARAGVSTATASLVLNNRRGRFSASTAEAVRRAAAELGYRPDLAARGLRTSRTQTLALVSDEILTTPYANQMIQGAQDGAWEREHLLFMVNTGGDERYESELIDSLRSRRVDGFIYGSLGHRSGKVPVGMVGVPVVGMDIELAGASASFVPDEIGGTVAAVSELLAAGHRRIAHVTEPDWAPAQQLRLGAFAGVMRDAGCLDLALVRRRPVGVGVVSPSVSEWGERAAMDLLQRPDRPTAVFAYNDQTAMGVYRAARELGLRIPEDLSVVGFDDQILVAAELSPELTTVALPHYTLGRLAAETLLEIVSADNAADVERPSGTVLIPCPMVHRKSVGPPPRT
jgi:LacI family transcriptional regulator, galactose operon repressor